MPRRFVVGLTGGIGSGKSAAADAFARLGAGVVDTDAIAHALTAPGGAAMPAIVAAFGPELATADGALDRAAMRARVFADPAERARLEALLHPLIRTGSEAALAALADAVPYAVLVVPLLVESGSYRARCDRIVVVDVPEAEQIARVVRRSGLSPDQVRAIMAAQADRDTRRAAADDLIDNAGSLEALEGQVRALDTRYRALAQGATRFS